MSANSRLYDKTVLKNSVKEDIALGTKTFKGFSTISNDGQSFSLYDLSLIKQDIINHFHIRQGERLENPTFGTIIWDMIFEPLTETAKSLIIKDVETIINYDPRVQADEVIVSSYESGIQIECRLTYIPYNIQEQLAFRFDQSNSLIS